MKDRKMLIVGLGLLSTASLALAATVPEGETHTLLDEDDVNGGSYSVEGTLIVNGAEFKPDDLTVLGAGEVFFNAGSIAPLTISLSDSGALYVNDSSSTGTMTVNSGTVLHVNSQFNVTSTLAADGFAGLHVTSLGTLTVDSYLASGSTTLSGDGDVLVNGSFSHAGFVSPGEVDAVGQLTLSASSVSLADTIYELSMVDGGLGLAADLLTINGTTSLGGSLNISAIDGDLSALNGSEVFTILQSSGLSGEFPVDEAYGPGRVTVSDFNAFDGSFLVAYDYDAGTVSLTDFQPVPEPALLGMLGLAGLALRRRRA